MHYSRKTRAAFAAGILLALGIIAILAAGIAIICFFYPQALAYILSIIAIMLALYTAVGLGCALCQTFAGRRREIPAQ